MLSLKLGFVKGRGKWLLIGGLVLAVVLLAVFFVGLFSVGLLAAAFPEPCVALVKVDGEITTSSSQAGLFSASAAGSDELVELLKEAGERSEVKAVVVEINSPGGGAVASEEIYDALKKLEKPKVAFFREVAASGGYYVGVGTDYIVSSPDALTGSIGARATLEDFSKLFEKIGLNYTTIKTGEFKDIGDPSRSMNEKERAIIQSIIDESFQKFKSDVEANRRGRQNFNQANFETVLDARILTGRQAYKLGLVDELGNKQAALDKAAELAGMDANPKVCVLEAKQGFFEELLQGAAQDIKQTFSLRTPKVSLSYS